MTKATSSAVDFLKAVAGKTELFEVAGVTVELRSLTFDEISALTAAHKDNDAEIGFSAALLGIVNPKLDEAQLVQLRKSAPGPVAAISTRIMILSGLREEGESASPLAGGGLL